MPVEGYTSYLWVLLLDVVWRVFDIVPPKSANWISLAFSSLTVLLGVLMCLQLNWIGVHKKYRLVYLIVFLAGVLGNRTFLAWTSSGLETAMFNFLFLLWLYGNFYLQHSSRMWLWVISGSASLLYLTRPDGILAVVATGFLIFVAFYRKSKNAIELKDFISVSPLAAVPVHLFWRRLTYGEWLPNTFVAKSAPSLFWVTSGAKYLLLFVIEYALWIYLALLLVYIIRKIALHRQSNREFLFLELSLSNLARGVSIPVLLGHFAYYTFVVGGDYFEFRVYSHWIFLIFLSSIWLIIRVSTRFYPALLFLAVFLVASWIIPWTHWSINRSLTRDEIQSRQVLVSSAIRQRYPVLPDLIYDYLRYYDNLQKWLLQHRICVRYHQHKLLWLNLVKYFPTREDGSMVNGDGFPVVTQHAVGVLSWVLPNVNVIDLLGLNDYIIARNTDINSSMRMAHFRRPPEDYVDCFDPNVRIRTKKVTVLSRDEPLTEEKIMFCEQHYLQLVNESVNK
jgi:arabinofuranosyltransferase